MLINYQIKLIVVCLFSVVLLLFLGCKPKISQDELVNADVEFCNMAKEKGISNAFIYYADENAIIMREGNLPLVGKSNITKFYSARKDNSSVLEWEPTKSEISSAGDFGYTFGNWRFFVNGKQNPDTIHYGNYITVWKKQPDGSWKYVFDGGNDTPKPL